MINVARRTVVVAYHAQPTFVQWSETMNRIFAHADYQPDFGIVLDRRAISRPATTEYIKDMVNFIDRHMQRFGPARWAIVISDPGSYGMGRMAEQISEFEHAIRPFHDLPSAEEWLGA